MLFNVLAGLLDLAVLYNIGKLNQPKKLWIGLAVWLASTLILAIVAALGFFHLLSNLTDAVFIHATILLMGIGFILLFKKKKVGGVFIAGAAILIAIGIDAFFVEPTWLETSHYTITSPKIEQPFKIAVLADLQTDYIGRYEKEVLKGVVNEKPDLILLTGDYIQSDRDTWGEQVIRLNGFLKNLGFEASLGIYAVQGNVDPPGAAKIFDGLPVIYSEETHSFDVVNRQDLLVTGLSLWDSFNHQLLIPQRDAFHIVFGHSPNFALGEIKADLLFAGHAHGGQVQLPWLGPLLTLSRVPRLWVQGGLIEMEESKFLVVSRGIGMERGPAPRLRFLCRPQLVFVTVQPEIQGE